METDALLRRALRARVAAAALLLCACAAATDPREVVVEICGGTTHLRPGNALVVRLPSPISAGYLWRLATPAGELLLPAGEPLIEGDARGVDGGQEFHIHRFHAAGKGETTLLFHNLRPWQKNKPPRQTCTITVEEL